MLTYNILLAPHKVYTACFYNEEETFNVIGNVAYWQHHPVTSRRFAICFSEIAEEAIEKAQMIHGDKYSMRIHRDILHQVLTHYRSIEPKFEPTETSFELLCVYTYDADQVKDNVFDYIQERMMDKKLY
jgi:hypothetical protein